MKKKNFKIRFSATVLREVEGFVASIKTPGGFKFGVCEFQGEWRTSELSTGYAVPGSFADNAEDSVKGAQITIDVRNSQKTYFQGIVEAASHLLASFAEEKK